LTTVLVFAYRPWAKDIYHRAVARHHKKFQFILVSDKDMVEQSITEHKPKHIFFLGWSWIIPEKVVDNNLCLCLHPSPLPKYRGGSPLQHQILNNEKEGAVTLFQMNKGIDTGDIWYQEKISLEGSLDKIFLRITEAGSRGINRILSGNYTVQKQDDNEASYYKRRTPEMSEISIKDFGCLTALELYNKIRCLQDPYPNPYVLCKDGSRLYFKEVYIDVD
tara:strand:+ start:1195 stop:1854 length:660 start_codon:yes stop_codon:yes gene_type:complete